ncbi:MAG: hypothetical protein A4E57_01627 [Syntrophorhabdaceae bacterium PtaU1.Bin034]|jgi:nucleotide-binding universal stress UspA family protein|nr:MAG: hypothetical protein A4E57_01627 [Syntrophorhabdaceae bacterium PtaU1.Bin034]
MLKPASILVPTDFSEHSDKAFAEALDIAQQYKAKLYLLHVIHEDIHACGADYCLSDELMRQVEDNIYSGAKQSLQQQLEKFPQAKNVEVVTEVRRGVPAEQIIEVQEKKGIDLIVISPLGRTGLAKYFVGSVTKNVVKGAKSSVLIVR